MERKQPSNKRKTAVVFAALLAAALLIGGGIWAYFYDGSAGVANQVSAGKETGPKVTVSTALFESGDYTADDAVLYLYLELTDAALDPVNYSIRRQWGDPIYTSENSDGSTVYVYVHIATQGEYEAIAAGDYGDDAYINSDGDLVYRVLTANAVS